MLRRYICLTLLLTGCGASKFDTALSEDLKTYDNKQREIFNQIYTRESAEKEAKEYCNKRNSEKTENEINEENANWQINLKNVTPEEASYLLAIRVSLQTIGLYVYCPQYKNKQLPPLKDRIK